MATPVIQSKATGSSDATTTVTVTKPSGTVDDDLLVALVFTYDGSAAHIPSDESGWTTIASATRDFSAVKAYYKIAATEGASYTFDFTSSDSAWGIVYRIDGHAAGAPIADDATGTLNSTTATPSITVSFLPTVSDALIVMGICSESLGGAGAASGYIISGTNPTWTEQGEDTEGTDHLFASATATANSTTTVTTMGYNASSTGQKHFGILLSIPEPSTASATPASISLPGVVPTQSPSADVNITPDSIAQTSGLSAPTTKNNDRRYSNTSKSADGWTNQSKS